MSQRTPYVPKKKTGFTLPRGPYADAELLVAALDAAREIEVEILRAAGASPDEINFRLPNFPVTHGIIHFGHPGRKAGPANAPVAYGDIKFVVGGKTFGSNVMFKNQQFSIPSRDGDRSKKPTVVCRKGPGEGSPLVRLAEHIDFAFKKFVAANTYLAKAVKASIVDGPRQPKTLTVLVAELLPQFYAKFPWYSGDQSSPSFHDPCAPENCYVTNEDWQAIKTAWNNNSTELQALCSGLPFFLKSAKVPNLVQTIVMSGEDAGKVLEDPIFRATIQMETAEGDRTRELGVNAVFTNLNKPLTATTFEKIPVTPENIDTLPEIRGGTLNGVVNFSLCVSSLAISIPTRMAVLMIRPSASSVDETMEALGDLFFSAEEKAKNLATATELAARAAVAPAGAGAGAGAGHCGGGAGAASGGFPAPVEHGEEGAPDDEAMLAELGMLA